MFNKKTTASSAAIESLISAGTTIEGNIRFKGGLRIDGTVKGNVVAEEGAASTLVLSESGRIEGQVSAAHLMVNGAIVGPITATETIELQPKAKVNGEIHYVALEMHHGAVVDGTLMHLENGRPGLKLAASNEN
jgi:cytoskeletal protein CcmA (bactofilin family)